MGWTHISGIPGRLVHVLPMNDLIDHDYSDECLCGPRVEWCDPGYVVVHNALDGREQKEADMAHKSGYGKKKPKPKPKGK